jgi:hypothetical protein
MTKKLKEHSDFTGISNDEIYYQGERFIESLSELLADYKSLFGRFEEFMQLEKYCRIMYNRLKAEERIVV